MRSTMKTWVLDTGFAMSLVSALSFPFLPTLPAFVGQQAMAEAPPDVGVEDGDGGGSAPSPVDQFMSIQEDLYQRLFGYSNPDRSIYHLDQAVSTGPGLYEGFNEQGFPFVFEAKRFAPGGEVNEMLGAGVRLTEVAAVTGVIHSLEEIEVVALTGTIVSGGTNNYFLVPLGEVDTLRADLGFDTPLPAGPGVGWSPPPAGDDCECPEPGDPCLDVCAVCPDGVAEFCPTCNPALCQAGCDIEKIYDQCIQDAIIALMHGLIVVEATCIAALIACIWFSPTPAVLIVCLAGIVLCVAAMVAAHQGLMAAIAACKTARQNNYNFLYIGFCDGAP